MRSLALIALLLAACSFDPEKADASVTVQNIDAAADHLVVTVTLPDNTTKTYQPSFQPGALATNSIDLAFSAGGQTGSVTVKVEASDRAGDDLGDGTATVVVPQSQTVDIILAHP